MSHLSILPTVLEDAQLLAETLESRGLTVHWQGSLPGFADQRIPVILWVALADGQPLGWCRADDGSLSLVGDLQRIVRHRGLQPLIGSLTREYAARLALRAATAAGLGSGTIEFVG